MSGIASLITSVVGMGASAIGAGIGFVIDLIPFFA